MNTTQHQIQTARNSLIFVNPTSVRETYANALDMLETQLKRKQAAIVFKVPHVGTVWAYRVDSEPMWYDFNAESPLARSLNLAWVVLSTGGVNIADFSFPETKHPEDVLRRTLRGECADWATRNGLPGLALVLRSIKVGAKRVTYDATDWRNHPLIITGQVAS